MKITDLFIRRPVLALVVNLVIIIAGLQAVRTLNVRQYPRSENAAVTVTTVYVGADAELVRGFVTAPLERAIAAADGIEYMESQSSLGLSTIKARLRLNFDSTKALAEISSKVDQVRRDLPPEAEVPAINIESADSEFASAYLSFTSDILQQNEITDYLVRIVQPRLSAVSGVQRADILGGRTFAMRIWLKPERMAALNISPAQVRRALAANNFLAALGRSKGALIQVNLTANTNLSTVDEFKRLAVREQNGSIVRLGEIADVVLGAEDYDAEVRFSGQTAVFMGIWPLPNANSIDVLKRVRAEMAAIQSDLPGGLQARVAYDATEYINNAIQRGAQNPRRHAADRRGRHLPLSRLLPLGLHPGGGDPGVAHRRRLPDAGLRLHRQPPHPAGDRPLGRPRGGRRHRGGGERGAPHEHGEVRRWRRPCKAPASWSGRSSP